MGTTLCSSPALVDVAVYIPFAAHWLAGSAGRFAGARWPGRALALRRLDSAAAGDGGARLAVCFMLVVSCAPAEVCYYKQIL